MVILWLFIGFDWNSRIYLKRPMSQRFHQKPWVLRVEPERPRDGKQEWPLSGGKRAQRRPLPVPVTCNRKRQWSDHHVTTGQWCPAVWLVHKWTWLFFNWKCPNRGKEVVCRPLGRNVSGCNVCSAAFHSVEIDSDRSTPSFVLLGHKNGRQ